MNRAVATFGLLSLFLLGCVESHAPGELPPDTAEPQQFCTDREFWECRREEFAGRIDSAMADACYAAVDSTCAELTWPAGCAPSQEEADACIGMLQRADLVDVPTEELYMMRAECELCPGS